MKNRKSGFAPLVPYHVSFLLSLLCVFALMAISMPASANSYAQSTTKLECVSGGVGLNERAALQTQQETHNFWLITAARKTGEFLSGIKVNVIDQSDRKTLISCVLDGPWLFLELPLGLYEVEAIYQSDSSKVEQKVKKKTHIHPADRHQMVIYFDGVD